MRVHFTTFLSPLSGGEPALSVSQQAFLRDLTSESMPFVLDAKGRYEHTINAWLRGLPGLSRCKSPETWKAFARDVARFGTFLESSSTQVVHATRRDLERYHRLRRLGENPISARTWNREVAALANFYRWCVDEGLLRVAPWSAGNVAEASVRESAPNYVSLSDFKFFQNVGLRGLTPDGRQDPNFGGECVERNAVFAELLVTTGLRCREASYALLSEVPDIDSSGRRVMTKWPAQPGLTKGRKPRETVVPNRVLRALAEYVAIERAEAIRYGVEHKSLIFEPEAVLVTAGNGRATLANGQTIRTSDLLPHQRLRLYMQTPMGVQPLQLFVTNKGTPMRQKTWDNIFVHANDRCASFGRPLHVTPHTLRHTFAVQQLIVMIKQYRKHIANGDDRYLQFVIAPMRKLMRYLGHANESTTNVYLGALGDDSAGIEELLGITEDMTADWDFVDNFVLENGGLSNGK